jgi:hypothetical protein
MLTTKVKKIDFDRQEIQIKTVIKIQQNTGRGLIYLAFEGYEMCVPIFTQ